jgi:hypothetical protein
MLSNREKKLVTLAYYQGTCDNSEIVNDLLPRKEKFDISFLKRAVYRSTSKVLDEFGLDFPDTGEFNDLYDYLCEMEEITAYLCKEDTF